MAAPVPDRPDGKTPAAKAAEAPAVSDKIDLHDAVRRALRESPELKAFGWTAESALARVRQAALWPNPEIEFERENFGGSGQFSGSARAENTLALSQMLPLGGDIKHRRRLAEAERDLAAWDYHAARLGVVLSTSRRYVDTLAAERRLDIAQRELDLAHELESVTRKRVEAGEASPVEQSRVAVPVVEAELELTRAELASTAARQRLALTWGERRLGDVRLVGALEKLSPLPEPSALVATVNDAPEVARWAAEISASEAAYKLVRAEAIPDPVLRVGIKQDEGSNDHGLIVGISLPLPLFDRNQGDLAAARAGERAAQENRRAAELRVESALSNSYFTLAVAHAESTALDARALPAARKAYEATLSAFSAGQLPYLDVLDASRSLLELERRHIDALVSYHNAKAELEALLGGRLPKVSPQANIKK
ncbi:MAG TPA: TolC family protein [Opitutales bacterium]|nr:TolC family protein [Opitutales bacterium]